MSERNNFTLEIILTNHKQVDIVTKALLDQQFEAFTKNNKRINFLGLLE